MLPCCTHSAPLPASPLHSWMHHEGDAADADNPQRARQCQYLVERVLHGLLRATLSQAEADCAAPPLAPAERHAVVAQALEDAELQLGLVNACIEVGAATVLAGMPC